MTVTLTTVNERGEVQASRQFVLRDYEAPHSCASRNAKALRFSEVFREHETQTSLRCSAQFEDAEEALRSLEVLEKMGYVTSERPAILEINGREYEIRPSNGSDSQSCSAQLNEWINAPGITEGDEVFDREGPSWSNGFEVVSVTGTRADEYVIGSTDWGEKVTVAAENPNYPKYDGVIEVTPIDGNNKEYAYPASRLRPAHSVPYPTDGGNDE